MHVMSPHIAFECLFCQHQQKLGVGKLDIFFLSFFFLLHHFILHHISTHEHIEEKNKFDEKCYIDSFIIIIEKREGRGNIFFFFFLLRADGTFFIVCFYIRYTYTYVCLWGEGNLRFM
jgi:hypothetical protein